MGKYYHKMHCSMMIAALSRFGSKLKIALTGVRSRVRESLTKRLIESFNSVLFAEFYFFPYTKCFPTIKKINWQNYDELKTTGTYLLLSEIREKLKYFVLVHHLRCENSYG